ncbi:hypothetical protein BDZ94DRAFT_1249458 [Collybia nuda]|uniref:Uncharacterized protein n=1 Tax=Collybia nuda TaxID=64659 RepID=A0A9P6CNZ1_9AGAR|nr:hypothetical protein BDZ94DRAFT_1249458 [Collybia nuda]
MTSGSSKSFATSSFRLDETVGRASQGAQQAINGSQNTAGTPGTLSQPYRSYTLASSSQGGPLPTPGANPYYNYSAWQNSWSTTPGYPYSGVNMQQEIPQAPFVQYQPQAQSPFTPVVQNSAATRVKTPSPSPSPPPAETYRHWDQAVKSFLTKLGLTQAVAGFEADLVVFNPEWEQKKVPDALADLINNLSVLGRPEAEPQEISTERSLDERKLDYIRFVKGVQPRTPTTINRSISAFLAKTRARNDASNRAEFVKSLAEKRRRLDDEDPSSIVIDPASCARTDAKPIDRDQQIKYDIAKNEDGPLSRTIKLPTFQSSKAKGKQKAKDPEDTNSGPGKSNGDSLTSDRYPALDERLKNIESHLSVRYVPSLPRTLLDRLKFLENHIIQLEKEYPPWAALHFNQPRRGWPPPPRATPIIVPPHQRALTKDLPETPQPLQLGPEVHTGPKPRNVNSSLHRAVLERLEVQQAKSDLAGSG